MIPNNFVAMQRIRELRETPLTPEVVLSIQQDVTTDAIDGATAVGRLRRADEDIKVVDAEGNVLHVPRTRPGSTDTGQRSFAFEAVPGLQRKLERMR